MSILFGKAPRKTVALMAHEHENLYLVLALCNDGTIWQLVGIERGAPKWEQIPNPPEFDPDPPQPELPFVDPPPLLPAV